MSSTQAAPQNTPAGAEQVAKRAGGARVVKIFNNTGSSNMANPRYGSEALTMFYAGDDSAAKATAAQLASDLGFDPIDAGPLANSRFLEALASFFGSPWRTPEVRPGRRLSPAAPVRLASRARGDL